MSQQPLNISYTNCEQKKRFQTQHHQQLIRAAKQLSECASIQTPQHIYILRNTSDGFIKNFVTIPRLQYFLKRNQNHLKQDQMLLIKFINIYKIRVSELQNKSDEKLNLISNHLCWLINNINKQQPKQINTFVQFLIVLSNQLRDTDVIDFRKLPKYFLTLQCLNFKVFFYCASECLNRFDYYNFNDSFKLFVQKISQNLTKFNQKYVGNNDKEIDLVCQLFFSIINLLNSRTQKYEQFNNIVINNLISNRRFHGQLIYYMKKYNKQVLFSFWVQFLIKIRQFDIVKLLIQNITYLFSNIAEKFEINSIVLLHHDFSDYWINQMMISGEFVETGKKFLNQNLYSFIVFNNALKCFHFRDQNAFYQIILSLDYEEPAKKWRDNEEARESIKNLFSIACNPQQILDEYFYG